MLFRARNNSAMYGLGRAQVPERIRPAMPCSSASAISCAITPPIEWPRRIGFVAFAVHHHGAAVVCQSLDRQWRVASRTRSKATLIETHHAVALGKLGHDWLPKMRPCPDKPVTSTRSGPSPSVDTDSFAPSGRFRGRLHHGHSPTPDLAISFQIRRYSVVSASSIRSTSPRVTRWLACASVSASAIMI